VLLDLVRKLVELIKSLISRKCECVCNEELEEISKELNEVYQMLQDWIKRVESGGVAKRTD
jgi:uncharacterized coiled-coil DUF342 family protein